MPVKFLKTRPGEMGILTIPKGTQMWPRYTFPSFNTEPKIARHDFRTLALPSHAPGGKPAYSIKLGPHLYYILEEDLHP